MALLQACVLEYQRQPSALGGRLLQLVPQIEAEFAQLNRP